jgi:hypothetical protein
MQTQTAIAPPALAPADTALFHRIWPPAMIAFGLGLTVAWVALLGYGLVSIIELAPSGSGAGAVVAIAVCVCMVALSFLAPKAVTPGFTSGGATEHNVLGRGEAQRLYPKL